MSADDDSYGKAQNPGGGYGSSQKPGTYTNSAKPTPKPRAAINDVHLHFYLPTPQDNKAFLNYLQYSWDNTGQSAFDPFAVSLTLFEDKKQGLAAFKRSINTAGTIVVYMGHTSLIEKKKKVFVAEGLAPEGAKKTILKNAALVGLLEKAKANIVILAGCATEACIPAKLKNNVIVITTASGRDGVTHSAFWARAITGFLLALVGWKFDRTTVTQLPNGSASIQEALTIANNYFPAGDSFVLSSGDGTIHAF